jgi:hypothetical protein
MLYARRLMPCGSHCPNWSSCPLGGGSADQGRELLKRREVDWPTCPFEQAEYSAVVTDALRRTQKQHENAWGMHVAHQVALMTVLVGRAARALSTRPFVDKHESYHNEQLVLTERPGALFIAYDKLSRELRRWTILLERCYDVVSCDKESARNHRLRQRMDTAADPDAVFVTMTGIEHLTAEDAVRAAREAEEVKRRDREERERAKREFMERYEQVDGRLRLKATAIREHGAGPRSNGETHDTS